MSAVPDVYEELSESIPAKPQVDQDLTKPENFNLKFSLKELTWKKFRGGIFLVVGYLLSPLCWWNDLFFNLPVAYAFGYVFSLLNQDLLVPCTIAGYWLSNIVGIFLIQLGTADVFQDKSNKRNLKKSILTGVVTSTAFSILILILMYLQIIEAPSF